MNRLFKHVVAVVLLAFGVASHAVVVSTIDLTPIGGTSFADMTSASGTRFNFGTGYGPGRVSISAVSPGGSFGLLTRNSKPSMTTLDNGNIYAVDQGIVFDLLGNNTSFLVTVALDSGLFRPGSVFEMLSLDRSGSNAQYFLPGAGIGAVDSHQLPSDGNVPLVAGVGGLFSAQSNGISLGRVWDVGGVNSFSGTFSQDRHFGGVAFRIGVATVPEPASLLLMLVGLLALAGIRAARQSPDRRPA